MSQIVLNGNNIDLLKKYPDNYFDAVVTDPPYGLGKEPNAEEVMKGWVEKGYHEVGGSGFMGKEWDAFIPQPIFWKEVFRVLKHGGHVVSFFGTRTYDWGVMSMRFAGFEVRDCIQWLYGSGFPKSHNISKAIDKLHGAEREVIGEKVRGDVQKAKENGSGYLSDPANRNNEKQFGYGIEVITKATTDEAKQWDGWGSALKPANEPIVVARKPVEKGLSIAENVLKWGVGGINIDGSRVGLSNGDDKRLGGNGTWKTDKLAESIYQGGYEGKDISSSTLGRFPANLILTHHPECECKGLKKIKAIKGGSGIATMNSGMGKNGIYGTYSHEKLGENAGGLGDENGEETIEHWECHPDCPIKIMDEQSGILKSGDMNGKYHGFGKHGIYGKGGKTEAISYGDTGGSSRFFYCAKASKSERNNGLDKERWFYNLELVLDNSSFTEQNLFIWEQEVLNQNTDLNGEVQQKRDISEGIVLLVEDKECYTTLFGKEKEVLFPKVIKFTTSTGISQIIELKTLNFYQHLNISDCIADVIEMNKANGLNLAENVGIKNLLKQIFIKDEMGFLLGVKIVAKKMPQLINVKDAWQKSNIHSTVKPVKLMQYLVRLITPPNGLVLDPFCGSGTTGIACKLEGFNFVGMEQDAEYSKIAQARIENYQEEPLEPLELIQEDSNGRKIIQTSLF